MKPDTSNASATSATTLQGPPPHDAGLQTLTRCLGYLSLAIGVVELVWPRQVMRAADMGENAHRPALPSNEAVVRAQGVRELAVGTGLLTAAEPEPWVWGRVAGDVLDIAAVLSAPRRGSAGGSRVGTLLGLLAVTAVDVYCAQALRRERHARAARARDWSRRSGFAQPAEAMRGAASDFVPASDMRTPELLRPWAGAGKGH